ncbi:MAG: hypothetical protein OZ948_05450 [Deltaproteobacteria bacterium]|nr:hypothetical protein [Deltaproteobacteria bacterium]
MRAWLRHRPGWVLSTLLVLAGWSAPSARASELRLEAVTVESSAIVVDVLASDLHDAGSFDLIVRFDPERLAAPTRERGVLARHGMALDHTAEPGSYRLAVLVPSGVSGEGQLARLRFPVQAASGSVDLELEARVTDLTGTPIDVQTASARVALGADPEAAPEPTEVPAEDERAAAPREDPEGEKAPEADAEASASGEGAPRFDADGRPLDPERRAEDLAARAAGHRLQVQFEPRAVLADGPSPRIRLRVRAWRSIEALSLAPATLQVAGAGVRVEGIEPDGNGLSVRLVVERRSLPASVELAAFGLLERHPLPVYPRVDVDLDGDGTQGARDRQALIERLGLRAGREGYDDTFDLVRNGVIDAIDLEAFRANLVESERVRRLEQLRQSAQEKTQNPVAGRAEAP